MNARTPGAVLVMLILSLVSLCPVVLPKAFCIPSCPCKPWREGLAAVLPSVRHGISPDWNQWSTASIVQVCSMAVLAEQPNWDPTGLIQNPIKSGRK